MCPINTGSGGPTYVLTGVVTWGVDCAKVGFPSVFTRITNYTNWCVFGHDKINNKQDDWIKEKS